MCHVCPPLWAFSDLKKHFNITVTIGPLRLGHIFSSFPPVRGAYVASGLCSVLFVVPGIYVETYVYDDGYVRLLMTSYINVKSPIMSGSHILDRQGPIIYFPHNFTKKYFFSKFDLFLKQLGQIFPKNQ